MRPPPSCTHCLSVFQIWYFCVLERHLSQRTYRMRTPLSYNHCFRKLMLGLSWALCHHLSQWFSEKCDPLLNYSHCFENIRKLTWTSWCYLSQRTHGKCNSLSAIIMFLLISDGTCLTFGMPSPPKHLSKIWTPLSYDYWFSKPAARCVWV